MSMHEHSGGKEGLEQLKMSSVLTCTASTTSNLWSPPSCTILSSHWLYDQRFFPSLYALQAASLVLPLIANRVVSG